jgi:hypothetical protein
MLVHGARSSGCDQRTQRKRVEILIYRRLESAPFQVFSRREDRDVVHLGKSGLQKVGKSCKRCLKTPYDDPGRLEPRRTGCAGVLTVTRGLNVDVELITRDCLLFGHQRKQKPKITKSTYGTSHVRQLRIHRSQLGYPRSLGGDVLYN